MKFICNFLLVLNYIVYIIADVSAWATDVKYGLLLLLPLIVFEEIGMGKFCCCSNRCSFLLAVLK